MGRRKDLALNSQMCGQSELLDSIAALKPSRRSFLLALTGITLVGCGGGGSEVESQLPVGAMPEPEPQPSPSPEPTPSPSPPPAPQPVPPPVKITADILLDAPMMDSLFPFSGSALTFTRTSAATVMGANGLMNTLAANQPRFAHDLFGQSYGVLIEQPDGQPLLHSQSFDNGVWTKTNATLVAANGSASDGTNRLWRLSESNVSGQHGLSQSVNGLNAGKICTLNAVVKKTSARYIALQFKTRAGNFHVARFDLGAGATHSQFNAVDFGVINLANGMQHVWAAFDTESGSGNVEVFFQLLAEDGSTANYIGSNQSVLISELWINSGPTATSYVRAQAAPTARAADQLFVNAKDSFRPNDCSGVLSFQFRGSNSSSNMVWYTGIDENNNASIRVTANQLIFQKVVSGLATSCEHFVNWEHGEVYRIGWRSSSITGMELVLDGEKVSSNASVNAKRDIEAGARLYIGSDGESSFCNCPISNVMVFSEA